MEQSKMTQVFGVSPDEFKESILTDVRAEIKSLAQNFQPITPQEYLTRQETAEILKVSLVTLSDWNKKKILNPYRLGNLIRYKRAEIEHALININAKRI
jgi:excisionase family DNA binding protein